MSFLSDPYVGYVIAAYAVSALILGALVWTSIAASRRARRELDVLERERRR